MTSPAWFLDDEPSARFPVYCRGNVGEVVPFVATPMASTVTTEAFRFAFTKMFTETGAFTEAEMADPAATGGLFGGYLYFNLAFARAFAARAPGMRVADVDQQMFGSGGDAPPFRRGPGDRSPRVLARTAIGLPRMMLGRKAPDLDAGRAEALAWIASIPAEPTDAEVAALAAGFAAHMAPHLRSLLEASFGAAIPGALVERIAARAIRDEPGLLVKAMSGLGAIETTAPAAAMWRLGRMAAASPTLSAAFDDGVPGLLSRLRSATDDDSAAFVTEFDTFLRLHGHRGPNEVELASDTWATNPESALSVIERLRFTAEAADPEAAAVRLAAERDQARQRLRAAVLPPLRPLVRRMLETGSKGTARREQAKGTLVLQIAALRRALFHTAERLVRNGDLPDRTQFFMVTVDELPAFLADPGSFRDELARRREHYEYLDARVPPYAFEGHISDPSTWPLRNDPSADHEGDTWTGIGVSAGVATGKARIVRDPGDPRGIEPGEILVAPLTDPAWTPLFLAAAAVVVDVGALQSHAAIVARELGVPAVVSVEGASNQIKDGDVLEVDGDRGIVTRRR